MRISSLKFRKKFGDGALLTSPMQTKYCHRNSSKKINRLQVLVGNDINLMFHFTRMEQKHLI